MRRMASFVRPLNAIAAALVGLGLVAGAANAAIVECRAVPGSYTVFLSEPSYTQTVFKSKDQLLAFMQRLHFELDQGRDGKWIRSPRTDVRFVLCVNRAPTLDGLEFKPNLIESLYTSRVLLEIWGKLDAEETGGDSSKLSAQMNYMLVPMRYAADLKEPAPAALQRLEYPEQGGKATGDFVQLLARPLDIDAFVASAFGFKLLREGDRELAHRNLCRASALLQKIENRPLAARTRQDMVALRTFVVQSAGRAIDEAIKDPGYSAQGILRLQDQKAPCAGEE